MYEVTVRTIISICYIVIWTHINIIIHVYVLKTPNLPVDSPCRILLPVSLYWLPIIGIFLSQEYKPFSIRDYEEEIDDLVFDLKWLNKHREEKWNEWDEYERNYHWASNKLDIALKFLADRTEEEVLAVSREIEAGREHLNLCKIRRDGAYLRYTTWVERIKDAEATLKRLKQDVKVAGWKPVFAVGRMRMPRKFRE